MNENINLFEILKDCPINTEFYCSEIDANIKFLGIYDINEGIPFCVNGGCDILVTDYKHHRIYTNRYGSIFREGKTPIVFPSKDQRDWSKWKCPKPKFDIKTLQPFDRVLARDADDREWLALLFSHINTKGKVIVDGCDWTQVIPYNDDTKHLVGIIDEAPEYYRYWED